jgi:hypothetical protein
MKDQLIFDTTDAASIGDSDSVGAFVRSDDGTLITHHTVGADEGLDVYILNTSIEVTATDLDIRDLSAAQDSVASWTHDGTGTPITSTVVGADTGLDVNVIGELDIEDAALANTAIAHAALDTAAANTAESVVAAALALRKYLWVYNNDNQKIWLGGAGVTQTTGFPVSPGSYIEMRAGAAIDVQVASRKASSNIRTLELS